MEIGPLECEGVCHVPGVEIREVRRRQALERRPEAASLHNHGVGVGVLLHRDLRARRNLADEVVKEPGRHRGSALRSHLRRHDIDYLKIQIGRLDVDAVLPDLEQNIAEDRDRVALLHNPAHAGEGLDECGMFNDCLECLAQNGVSFRIGASLGSKRSPRGAAKRGSRWPRSHQATPRLSAASNEVIVLSMSWA